MSIKRNQPSYTVMDIEYEHRGEDEGNEMNERVFYRLWRCSPGAGNPPFFLLKNPTEDVVLGERIGTLERMDTTAVREYFTPERMPKDFILRKWGKEITQQGQNLRDQPPEVIWDVVVEVMPFYREVPSIKKEIMDGIIKGNESLTDYIEDFLTEKCKKDKKLLFWARKSLLTISDDIRDYHLAKYRGHSLIIKTPKTGFSHVSEKIGDWYSHTSQASVRGFARGKDEIYKGMIHGKFGNIIFDEVKYYKETISDMALTPMEQGIVKISSAATEIGSKGAPAYAMITNAGKEHATTQDMLRAINNILMMVSSSPEALGSRLGLILFGQLDVVEKQWCPPQRLDAVALVTDAVRKLAIPGVKLMYKNNKIMSWLNKSLPEYKKTIINLSKQFDDDFAFGEMCKIFWTEHGKGAYSHVRGTALEYTLVTFFRELIELTYEGKVPTHEEIDALVEKVLKRAEENLNVVMTFNLESLKMMVKETEENKEVFGKVLSESFENLKNYRKAIVLAYCKYLIDGGDPKKMIPVDDLLDSYHSIDERIRTDKCGACSHFSKVRENFHGLSENAKKEMAYSLEALFGITLDGVLKGESVIWHIASKKNMDNLCDYIKSQLGQQEIEEVF